MPSNMPAITLDRISKRYRLGTMHDSLRDMIPSLLKRLAGKNGGAPAQQSEFWALSDVSFEVAKGETVGIIGPNGAGKSTVLKLLSKIIRQTHGTLSTQGRLAALIELGGGFHPDLTGAENIYLQGTMMGFSRREVARMYDSIVTFSELDRFLQTPVKRYSSGMTVRLGFAVAAHVQPDILLIDEVLAVGDLSFQQKCFKRIDELKETGTTMIFISHNLEAVQKLCDRVILLQGGRVIGQGDPSQMIQRYRNEVFSDTLKASNAQVIQSDRDFTIRNVTLRDVNAKETDAVPVGETLHLEVGYEAKRPIRQPSVRISLERLDGLVCHATSSRQNGLELETLEGEGTICLEYPEVNLLPNLYQVTVDIFEGDNLVPLASSRQNVFQITSDDCQEHGTVHLDHEWSLLQEAKKV